MVKQSPYSFGVARRFPDYMKTAWDGGKDVSLTLRPPLPQEITWHSFRLEAEPNPRLPIYCTNLKFFPLEVLNLHLV